MRELAISIYLLVFKLLFTLFKLFPLKNKVTFLISFPDNPMFIYQEMKKQKINIEIIFLCNPRTFDSFKKTKNPTYRLESKNIGHTLIGIYHLATSKQIIADNYYGFLAVTKFKQTVTCTQIWHSVGAIKQFGAMDPTNIKRTPAAIKRFNNVYKSFDQFAIGSDFMGSLFKKAMPAPGASFLKTGVARTDFFFDATKHNQIKHALYSQNPLLKQKKVILYAPTFRRYEQNGKSVNLDLEKMYLTLSDDYILLIKCHPDVKLELNLADQWQDFVFDYSNYLDVNELLLITDILITDYSSIPMEFVFRKKKMIFYAYDLDAYQADNGLWEDYQSSIPGSLVKNTDELIEAVSNQEINLKQLDDYANKWVQYCDGFSSERLVNTLFKGRANK